MFGLLGLIGLVVAGFAADATMNAGSEEAGSDEDQTNTDPAEAGGDVPLAADDGATADLLAMTFGDTNPDGMPVSDDIPDEPDADIVNYGTSGSDILNGGDGDDVLTGGAGKDAISGGGGDDRLIGGSGDDEIDGGTGDDRVQGRVGADRVTGGAGDDVLRGGASADYLAGGDGDDLLAGGEGDDTVLGGAGADDLRGGTGADTLDGGDGDDTLDGGPGADYLNAGAGNDVLRLSNDTYATGDAGADEFQIMAPGSSVIADYNAAEDRLVIVYEPDAGGDAPEVAVQAEGDDALILMDGQILARITNGAGLTLADIQMRAG